MVARRSAGIVLHRERGGRLEILIGHMGGPYWAAKDAGAWTIPKGEVEGGVHGEAHDLATAVREFEEETGHPLPVGERVPLGEIRQASGKAVVAWAVEGDVDPTTCASNTVEITWPPRSGRTITIPEIDRFGWFGVDEARSLVVGGQVELIDRLIAARLSRNADTNRSTSSSPMASESATNPRRAR